MALPSLWNPGVAQEVLRVNHLMQSVWTGELSASPFRHAISPLEHTAARERNTLSMTMDITTVSISSALC